MFCSYTAAILRVHLPGTLGPHINKSILCVHLPGTLGPHILCIRTLTRYPWAPYTVCTLTGTLGPHILRVHLPGTLGPHILCVHLPGTLGPHILRVHLPGTLGPHILRVRTLTRYPWAPYTVCTYTYQVPLGPI